MRAGPLDADTAVDQVIVIGASTGGLHALSDLLKHFPSDLSAAVFVTMHIGNNDSLLPFILAKHTPLKVAFARPQESIKKGHVYIAPPDHHLLVERHAIDIIRGAKENYARPAIDPMFRSAAASYGQRAIGVILTGQLDDGVIGLDTIKAHGGLALVQDPDTAEARSMPDSALRHVEVDACLPLSELADVIVRTVKQWAAEPPLATNVPRIEPTATENELAHDISAGGGQALDTIGVLSGMSCPECGGALWQLCGAVPHFRCHTGHSYTAAVLTHLQDKTLEEALWVAIRALHEKQILLERLMARRTEAGLEHAATEYKTQKDGLDTHKAALKELIADLRST